MFMIMNLMANSCHIENNITKALYQFNRFLKHSERYVCPNWSKTLLNSLYVCIESLFELGRVFYHVADIWADFFVLQIFVLKEIETT